MTRYHTFFDLVESGRARTRMTLWRWIDRGIFPPPVNLGPNAIGWTAEDIAEHDERVKAGLGFQPKPEWLERAGRRKTQLQARRAEREAAHAT